jgi:peptidoglycan/LPS O-acetylase OafA/YrhL
VERGFPTAHLWFLEYLLVFYGAALVIAPLGRIVPAGALAKMDLVFDRVMRYPWRSALFGAVTGALVWNGPWWGEPRVAAFNIKVYPDAAALYGAFFAVGWWMHRRRDCLESLKRFVAPGFIVALAALAGKEWMGEFEMDRRHPNYLGLKVATLYCAGLYSWLMTFALIGWFLKYAPEQRPWVRYLADSSYWCYLMHLPLLVFLQTLAAQWPVYSYVKFTLVLAVTMAVLMGTYRWWVRYSWVGRMLNGVRTKND